MISDLNNSQGSNILRPRARLLRSFGDELISKESVALIELVKNAYDADATRVWVCFYEPLEVGKGMIEVIDTGHGMSLETIKETWMEPATLMRKRNRISEKFKRRVLGEKGIGRFASSRLADVLEVITKRDDRDYEVSVTLDWRQFDDEEKYLDEIKIPWSTSTPKEIRPNGVIQSLFERDGDLNFNFNDLNHGTILRMRGIRTIWGEGQFEDLNRRLSRLISPNFYQEDLSSVNDFKIILNLPEKFRGYSKTVEPPELIKKPHYLLTGEIKQNGDFVLNIQSNHEKIKEHRQGTFLVRGGNVPECGPFHIELRVWNRDTESLNVLSDENFKVADIREYLDFASGVSIYRDGFRLLPYGEPDNDWLRLDIRRVQNPTLNLSNNQIIGSIIISSVSNPELRDQSNREGIIESNALNDLRELILLRASCKILLNPVRD